MLKVRILEVDRQIIKQLGVNWSAVVGQLGSTQFILGSVATYGINGLVSGGLSAGSSLNTLTQPETTTVSANPLLNGLPIVCKTCTNGGQGPSPPSRTPPARRAQSGLRQHSGLRAGGPGAHAG